MVLTESSSFSLRAISIDSQNFLSYYFFKRHYFLIRSTKLLLGPVFEQDECNKEIVIRKFRAETGSGALSVLLIVFGGYAVRMGRHNTKPLLYDQSSARSKEEEESYENG